MTWFKCMGGSAPAPVETPSLELKYQNGTTGATTYTVDEDGLYLIAVTFSLGGSGSITLPAGRTAAYSNDFIMTDAQSREKGTKIAVVSLETGDVVTLTTAVGAWTAHGKAIFKLPFSVTSLVDSTTASDVVCNYTLGTGSGTVLCIMSTWARQANGTNLYDYSSIGSDVDMLAGMIGVNTLYRIFTCDTSDFPAINTKGYDGGGTVVAVLQ